VSTEPESGSEFLADYLSDRDHPCPGCGYNLRGLPDPVCPECRQELELTIGLAEPRMGALLLSIGSLIAGAGAAGALMVSVLIISIVEKGFPNGRHAMLVIFAIPGACLITCGLPALYLSRRKGRVWFRKLPDERRRLAMVIALLLPPVWLGVFLWAVLSAF
jgi:hypothetical protein